MNPDLSVEGLIPFAFNDTDVPIIVEHGPDAIRRIVTGVFDDSTVRPFNRLDEVKKIFRKEPYNLENPRTDMNFLYICAVMLVLQSERSPNEGTTREMVSTATISFIICKIYFFLSCVPLSLSLSVPSHLNTVFRYVSLRQRAITCNR